MNDITNNSPDNQQDDKFTLIERSGYSVNSGSTDPYGAVSRKATPKQHSTVEEVLELYKEHVADTITGRGGTEQLTAEQATHQIQQLITKARINEVHKFLNRSDSLGESKYATRRIAELNKTGEN